MLALGGGRRAEEGRLTTSEVRVPSGCPCCARANAGDAASASSSTERRQRRRCRGQIGPSPGQERLTGKRQALDQHLDGLDKSGGYA